MTYALANSRNLSLLDALERRYSCRAYRADPVSDETIRAIVRHAQQAASWCNGQPWELIVTTGAATERFRTELYRYASQDPATNPDLPFPREYREPYVARRRECGFQLYDSLGITRNDREAYRRQMLENFRFFGAPHAAIVTTDEALGTYGAIDCGGFVTSFMLAANEYGVGSVAQAALASHSDFIRAHFGIPEDRSVVCGISFGYPDDAHPANSFRTRREQTDLVLDLRHQ